MLTVKIEIIDVNDNPPAFKERSVDLVFSESANIGSSRILIPATDPDSPVFGVHSYELLPTDTALGLISPEDEGSGGHLRLYVKSELDREDKAQYTFKVNIQSFFCFKIGGNSKSLRRKASPFENCSQIWIGLFMKEHPKGLYIIDHRLQTHDN